MTHQNNWVHDLMKENGRSAAARVHDFVRMNPPELLGLQTNKDPQNFLDKIKKIFEQMQLREAKAQEFMNLRRGNMTVQEYGLKFNQLSRYAPHMVADSRAQMNKFLYGVSDLVKTECRNAMLLGDMNISRLTTHAHQKSGSGNRSQGQQKFSAPAPSSAIVPSSKNRLRDSPSRQVQGGGGQCQNRLYALQTLQDQEGSPDVVTGTLRVFDLDVYALLDPGDNLSFITPYIAFQFSFLGHIVSSEGIRVDSQKIEAVKQLTRPTSATDSRIFLGLESYYRSPCRGKKKGASEGCSQACSLRSSPYEHIRQLVTVQNAAESSLVVEVKEKQESDPILLELKSAVNNQRVEVFSQRGHGVLCYQGAPKMYINLRDVYWWNGMKRDIADYVSNCPNCQQVKVEHQKLEDRGPQFTSHVWKSFHKGLGSQVNLSTAFHPQTDGQAERTIQTLEDMLRALVIDFKGSWDDHLPLFEFTYNNSYHSSIQIAPYEALYRHSCRSHVGWFEVGEAALIGPDSVLYAMEKLQLIKIDLRQLKVVRNLMQM
ncbi:uncharacterized protein [Solanum lycopersicum]|uniref:uncharacterized protein n=1 Tax=Solanum lycopersicum TaxID=4081 RepID=UPI003747B675